MRKMAGSIRCVAGVLSAFAVLALGAAAYGLINPNFSPLHLVEQSKLIVLVKFEKGTEPGKIIAKIDKVLKGKPTVKKFTLDLSTSAYKEHAKTVENMAFSNLTNEPVHFFVGNFAEEGAEEMVEEAEEGEGKAYLGIGKDWVTFLGGKNDVWEMDKMDETMLGCWHGGPDMLLRCIKYVLTDEDADVPVRTEAEWGDNIKAGNVPGKICAIAAVDLKGDGKKTLYVGSDQGDRLLVFDAKTKKFKDVTPAAKLASKSKAAAWADFDGDGNLDLLSWDGKDLCKHLQGADGTFKEVKLGLADSFKNGCIGLDVVDSGKNGLPAIVASTASTPVLLTPGDKDGMAARALDAAAPDKKRGKVGRCVVADLDGDLLPDIVQPSENAGLLYKAKAPADFGKPTPTPIALGPGHSGAYIGDFDMDGAFEVLCPNEGLPLMWHNYGKLKFLESFVLTGEPSYIAKPGGLGGMTGDVNNDGRQDFLIVYSGMRPQIFFNRGFRSFGHSHMLDLAEMDVLEQGDKGQYVGALADMNGDGAQDMLLALVHEGEIWVFFRDAEDALALSVALPLKGVNAGPVAVTGWSGDRCLGAWNVVAGTRDAFFGVWDPGPVTIKWQLPGGKAQKKEIVLEDKPVRFILK
jgi:hypothetical protein